MGNCPAKRGGTTAGAAGASWRGWCSDGSRRVVALLRRDGRLKRVRGRLDHQDLHRHRALGDWSVGCAADRTTATFRILHGSSSQAYISLSTVKFHIASLMSKIGARNRVEIAIWAYETRRVRP
jgi:transposase InsO family protein